MLTLKRNDILLLSQPLHDNRLLPVPRTRARLLTSSRAARAFRSVIESKRNNQVVNEFRTKMRVAEDLISKLAFSLKEIQGARKRRPKKAKATSASLIAMPGK